MFGAERAVCSGLAKDGEGERGRRAIELFRRIAPLLEKLLSWAGLRWPTSIASGSERPRKFGTTGLLNTEMNSGKLHSSRANRSRRSSARSPIG